MNQVNIERGVTVRRALLAVARACHAKGVPMPKQAQLVPLLGCSDVQIWRHMRQLVDEGHIRTVRSHKRIRIQEVRP